VSRGLGSPPHPRALIRGLPEARGTTAAYAGLASLVVLAASGAVALLLKQPWLFPSLGPTAMLFFQSPEQPAARPLNTVVGHVIGILVGWACLLLLVPPGTPPAPVGGLTPAYLLSGALSVAITVAVLALLALPHPPAGASTLIVSLGILTQPAQIASMVGAVLLVTLLGWTLDRLLLRRRR
jgi:CBS-domain-containing membrane protein